MFDHILPNNSRDSRRRSLLVNNSSRRNSLLLPPTSSNQAPPFFSNFTDLIRLRDNNQNIPEQEPLLSSIKTTDEVRNNNENEASRLSKRSYSSTPSEETATSKSNPKQPNRAKNPSSSSNSIPLTKSAREFLFHQQFQSLQQNTITTWWHDFTDFIDQTPVADVGVGLVVGASFTAVVSSFIEDILLPPIGLFMKGAMMSNLFIVLRQGSDKTAEYRTPAEAIADGAVTIQLGKFFQLLVNFMFVAMCVFFMIRSIQELRRRLNPDNWEYFRRCPYCCQKISNRARRCPYCTSHLDTLM